MFNLRIQTEVFPTRGVYAISRSTLTEVPVVTITIERNGIKGRGECRPYSRYNETPESVTAQIESIRSQIEYGLSRHDLLKLLPAGAARNAVDCALWDFEAKKLNQPVWELAGLTKPQPVSVNYTIFLSDPATMREKSKQNSTASSLKIKLTGEGDLERIQAIREVYSNKLVVDANEGWTQKNYEELIPEFVKLKVDLIEQPFPEANDDILRNLERPIPLCADESFHDCHSFEKIEGKYDMVNIKLDKTGGLTEAINVWNEARHRNYKIMIGCMTASSLSMAPAQLLTSHADNIDLDGAWLLEKDREPKILYKDSIIYPADRELWG